MCGGELSKNADGTYLCMSCGTTQTLVDDSISRVHPERKTDDTLENVYKSAMHAMATGNTEDAIRWFSSISDYRDSKEKIRICSELLDGDKKAQIYSNAFYVMSSSTCADHFIKASELFSQILDYKDSGVLYTECLQKAEECEKDEAYYQACEFMNEGNIHFLTKAAALFDAISDWKDSNEKKEYCRTAILSQQEEINQKTQRLNAYRKQQARKKRIIIISSILAIVAVIAIVRIVKSSIHTVSDIEIEMLSSDSRYDSRYYYVYMDFKIDNHSGATLDYLKVTTYFADKNGKSIGTMTSEYGSQYGDSKLNLKSKQSITKETYLSEYQSSSSYGTLFTELYNNGIDDLIITYEITYAEWSDGYTYKR